MLTLLATSSTPTEKAITNWNTLAEIQNMFETLGLTRKKISQKDVQKQFIIYLFQHC
jgi:aspartate/tyrosine/aromatic aminotransferase